MSNEADTCRRYVVPKFQDASWESEPHRINEPATFTGGRVIVAGRQGRRRPGKRADYILRYLPNFVIAVIEAKSSLADRLLDRDSYQTSLRIVREISVR